MIYFLPAVKDSYYASRNAYKKKPFSVQAHNPSPPMINLFPGVRGENAASHSIQR